MATTNPHRQYAVERQREIWDDRVAGVPLAEIARKHRVSVNRVSQILSEAVENIDATKWLQRHGDIALERLEGLYRIYRPKADTDLDAANFCLKVVDRQIKLMGLDAPKKVNVIGIIETWARKEGLETSAVIEVLNTMLPVGEI